MYASQTGCAKWGSCTGARHYTGCEEHVEICYRSRACGVHVKNIGCRRSVTHAVVRNYSGKGTKALFDLLEKNKGEVESLIRGIKGFVSYSLVRTTRGGFSRLPGQGWCRREHSGSARVDRQERRQNWCGPTNYLGRRSHAAIEVKFGVAPGRKTDPPHHTAMWRIKRTKNNFITTMWRCGG